MPDGRPRRKPGVLARQLGEEWILYDPESGDLHVVNEAAGLVWEMCDGSLSLQQMGERLRAAYSVPPDADVMADLEKIIASFRERGLCTAQATDGDA